MNDDILTENEIKAFKSMQKYWDEVESREDMSPLLGEAYTAYKILGIKVLDLIKFYIKHWDMEHKE